MQESVFTVSGDESGLSAWPPSPPSLGGGRTEHPDGAGLLFAVRAGNSLSKTFGMFEAKANLKS